MEDEAGLSARGGGRIGRISKPSMNWSKGRLSKQRKRPLLHNAVYASGPVALSYFRKTCAQWLIALDGRNTGNRFLFRQGLVNYFLHITTATATAVFR